MAAWSENEIPDQRGRTYVVTGAMAQQGTALAARLLDHDAHGLGRHAGSRQRLGHRRGQGVTGGGGQAGQQENEEQDRAQRRHAGESNPGHG